MHAPSEKVARAAVASEIGGIGPAHVLAPTPHIDLFQALMEM
jgi:hypothetical protein